MSAAATVLCLNLGYGLVGLSLVLAGTNLMDYLLRWRVSTRLLPSMKISLKLATPRNLSEVLKFGLWNTAITASVRLISYTDAIVIAAFMPVSAVAPFALAASMRSYFEDIFVRAGFVFFPAATELDAKGDQEGLRTLYLVSSKFMLLGSILCGSLAIYWARDFFRLWIGSAYAEPAGYPSIAMLFYLLVLGSMVSVAQRIGYQVLLGIRKVGLLAALFAIEGVSNLLASVILVRNYGLLGVALGTLFPAVIVQGFLQPFVVCRALQISLITYCRKVLVRPALVLLVLVPVLLRPEGGDQVDAEVAGLDPHRRVVVRGRVDRLPPDRSSSLHDEGVVPRLGMPARDQQQRRQRDQQIDGAGQHAAAEVRRRITRRLSFHRSPLRGG